MTITATVDQIPQIIEEAQLAANKAATEYFQNVLGGVDRYPCGFASVKVYGVRSNSKIGKALIAGGFRKRQDHSLELWNPSKLYCQNVDTIEEGAQAATEVLRKYGFTAYAVSRLD